MENTPPSVFLAFAIYRDIYAETVTDLWNALVNITDFRFELSINSSANIGFNRNRLTEQFLDSDCDYLVFIDQDMDYTPRDLKKLLDEISNREDAGIVSGLYVKRDGSFTPLSGWVEKDYKMKDMVYHLEMLRDNRGEVVECDLLPTGFMAIRREVFDTVKKPFFHVKTFEDGTEWSSDSVFCQKVKEAGWNLFLDLGIEVGHIGNYTYHPREMYTILDENLKMWKVHYAKQDALEKYPVNSKEYWDMIWKNEKDIGLVRNVYDQLYNLIDSFVHGRDNTILDIGSGPGDLAYMLHTSGNKVTCADISDIALDNCSSRGMDTLWLDVENEKLPKKFRNSFDYIIATEIIEHVSNLDNFFKIVNFGLKDKGVVILTCPNNRLGPEEEPEHVQRINKDKLFELLADFDKKQVGIFGEYLVGVGTNDTSYHFLE